MMLGTDVSALSTTAATAAAQGLSIVVPLYNEAAGLAHLHERLDDLARTLGQRYRLRPSVLHAGPLVGGVHDHFGSLRRATMGYSTIALPGPRKRPIAGSGVG